MTTALAPSAHPVASPSTYVFDGHAVRVIQRDGEPWFVAKDVVEALNLEWKTGGAGSTGPLDDDERGSVEVDTLGGRQSVAAVSESGLYTLILRSRDATTPGTVAHRFRKWVTGEVLPSIRKAGRYVAPAAPTGPLYEPLSGNDMINLTRLVWLIAHSFHFQSGWTQAVWKALRLATGVPAPNRFEVRHLPVLSEELRRIYRATESLLRAQHDAEHAVMKKVLRQRGALEPVLAEAQQHLDNGVAEVQTKLTDQLAKWREKEINALLERRPAGGGHYPGAQETLP